MNIPGNEAVRVAPLVFTGVSYNATNESNLGAALGPLGSPDETVQVIRPVSTIFSKNILVVAKITGVTANATLTIRKWYLAGTLFVDENFVLPFGVDTIFTSSSPLEEAEVIVTNNDAANSGTCYAELIARI